MGWLKRVAFAAYGLGCTKPDTKANFIIEWLSSGAPWFPPKHELMSCIEWGNISYSISLTANIAGLFINKKIDDTLLRCPPLLTGAVHDTDIKWKIYSKTSC
ncbi:hypothetical protein HVE01_16380 [Vreelandella venusta]|nr:hypothetical protein HVE01_16380 [Halomonas venusta]